jgi:hypothetical protein
MASPAATTAMTLYRIEEDLLALCDTAELVAPDKEQEFLDQFAATLLQARTKRDAIGHVLSSLEAQASLAEIEIKRLRDRKGWIEHAVERIEHYVVRVIEGLGTDAKGRFQKLDGNTVTLSLHTCSPSVAVKDEAAIPAEFKTIALKLPLPLWERILDELDIETAGPLAELSARADVAIDKRAVKAAIDGGAAVPGADLVIGNHTLVRK